MADAKTGKSGHPETEHAAGGRSGDDGMRFPIDQQSLLQLLDAHAKAVAVAVGEVLVEKLAVLQSRSTERTESRKAEHARSELHEGREEIERAHEQGEEAWLATFPPGDRERLRKTDRELCRLEETLEGPERLLDREDGYNRPAVKGEGTWRLPEYKPVPPDKREARDSGV